MRKLMMLLLLLAAVLGRPLQAAEPAAWPDLPEAVSSFGAAVCDGWLYVYSGHMGGAHEHSRDNLSQRFVRLNLAAPTQWQPLAMGTPLQGLPLVADDRYVYRVGGLQALNAKGQPDELRSVTEFERFGPAAKQWEQLAPLPAGRSSHDAVIVDGVLYVVGGWELGEGTKNWYDHGVTLRLDTPGATWEKLAQPFQRRALAVAAHRGKLYALGGMASDDKPSTAVNVLDLKSGTWSDGPRLPGEGMNGFGCAAVSVPAGLIVTTMDGSVLRLADAGDGWEPKGKLEHARFFHRLVPLADGSVLAVAGASMQEGHQSSLERIVVER
ncbi:MAG TPA: hypothetical protein VHZ24_17315 [Pirellulales bacterium]|nr:hypothetical protein [Pirellulales bacterium]